MIRLYAAIGAVSAIVALIAGIYWLGGKAEREAEALRKAREFQTTTERMNNADIGDGDPVDDADWLRKRGQR